MINIKNITFTSIIYINIKSLSLYVRIYPKLHLDQKIKLSILNKKNVLRILQKWILNIFILTMIKKNILAFIL